MVKKTPKRAAKRKSKKVKQPKAAKIKVAKPQSPPPAEPMSPREYVKCVTTLDRSIRGASSMLGVAVRQSQRFSTGETPVPRPVQKLLRVAVETGVSGNRLESL